MLKTITLNLKIVKLKTELLKDGEDYTVSFSIDHQTFRLQIPETDEMPRYDYAKWYQQQLEHAFNRISQEIEELKVENKIMINILDEHQAVITTYFDKLKAKSNEKG